jgi:archaellum biogenesis protein FlaJ (TadC family)
MVMHTVLIVLVQFIYEIFATFSAMVSGLISPEETANMASAGITSLSMFSASSTQMQMLFIMVTAITLVLTVANAMAVYTTGGGHVFKLAFYLGITSIMSGLVILAIPSVVSTLFGGMGSGG